MANKLTWVSIVSLALLSTVPLFKLVMLPTHSESLMIAGGKGKAFSIGIRGQEMGGVKESPERVDQVVASYLSRVQIPREIHLDSGYHRNVPNPPHQRNVHSSVGVWAARAVPECAPASPQCPRNAPSPPRCCPSDSKEQQQLKVNGKAEFH